MLYLNNTPASDVGVIVEHRPERPIPRRRVLSWDVPGRGRVRKPLDEWDNVTLYYDIAVVPLPGMSLAATVDLAVAWLTTQGTEGGYKSFRADPPVFYKPAYNSGYRRLYDDSDPLVYYEAVFTGSAELADVLHRARRARVSFDARPQRFLLSGDEVLRLNSNDRLRNPTGFTARPLIRTFGSGAGKLILGNGNLDLSECDNTFLDCSAQTAMGGPIGDEPVSVSGKNWPDLSGSEPLAQFRGGLDHIEIMPRWFTI